MNIRAMMKENTALSQKKPITAMAQEEHVCKTWQYP